MRGKTNTFLGDLSELCQRKHLKSAAVCKHRTIPIHEFPYAAHVMNEFVAGTNVQVIGIGQFHLTAYLLKLVGRHAALYRGAGTDIHENRGLYITVNGVKHTTPRAVFCTLYFKHRLRIFLSYRALYVRLKRWSSADFFISNATGLP